MEQILLPRPTEPRRGRSSGYTLVEVIVAMLISCIMVTSVFSVAISSKTSVGKGDRRLAASQAQRQISSQLKGYVTGCGCNPATGVCGAGCTPPTGLNGPNTGNGGVATWYFNNPSAGITDSLGNVYALSCFGTHSITGATVLPAWFSAAPFNATLSYSVSYGGACPNAVVSASVPPNVNVTVNWTEPSSP